MFLFFFIHFCVFLSKTEVDQRWSLGVRAHKMMASFTNGTESEHNWCDSMSQVSNGSNWWDATGAHWQSCLRPSWTILNHVATILGPSWAILGPS